MNTYKVDYSLRVKTIPGGHSYTTTESVNVMAHNVDRAIEKVKNHFMRMKPTKETIDGKKYVNKNIWIKIESCDCIASAEF